MESILQARGDTRVLAPDVACPAPVVSVVIVTFESADDIVSCLQSVRRATVPLEVIVIDNASRDATVQRVLAHPGLYDALACNRENVGFAKAVNQGIRRSSARFVLLLNPDSVLEPGALERALHALDMHADAAVAGCLLLNPDGTEQAGGRRAIPTPTRSMVRVLGLHRLFPGRTWAKGFVLSDEPLPEHEVDIEATSGAFMLVRRDAIEQVGELDEGYFMHCEDLDWCVRFRAARWRVLFVPDARVVHAKGQSSRARRVRVEWHKHKGMIRFYRKFFRSRYPAVLLPVIFIAVWTRFVLKTLLLGVASGRAMLLPSAPPRDRPGLRVAAHGRPAGGRIGARQP
jgi:GT2 family glycosyltransferase